MTLVFNRRPDPLKPPLTPEVQRYHRRLFGAGLALCAVGVVAGVWLQRAHVRGQLGLILAVVSGMLGLVCASELVDLPGFFRTDDRSGKER